MGRYLNRPVPKDPVSSCSPLCLSGDFCTIHPALVEFLSLDQWEDGTSRTRGTLTLFADGDAWKVCLNCKDSGRIAFVSATSVGEVLLAAEEALCRAMIDWRDTRRNGKGGKKS